MGDFAGLGIIGGSGLYDLPNFVKEQATFPDTPYGTPSSEIVIGTLGEHRIAFLSRHGPGHRLSPSEVPYAANIYALKALGAQRLLSVSAVGSLRESIAPRSFCIPDNLIDRTIGRRRTFFGDGATAHVSMADPFCSSFSNDVAEAALASTELTVNIGGTYVCIEGPQFSTRSESEMYRSWNASIIGMTALPEARLAREAELCYVCLAMVTDYDVWHSADDVSVDIVVENLMAMANDVAGIVSKLAAREAQPCDAACSTALNDAIITAPYAIERQVWDRLGPITDRYLREHSQA